MTGNTDAGKGPSPMQAADYTDGLILHWSASEDRITHAMDARPYRHLLCCAVDEAQSIDYFFVLPEEPGLVLKPETVAYFVSVIDAGGGVMVLGCQDEVALAIVNQIMPMCGGGNA